MIRFSDEFMARRFRPTEHEFYTPCPVCEATDVGLRYTFYPADPESGEYGEGSAEEPVIIQQRCNCLLGDDFAQGALDDLLGRNW